MTFLSETFCIFVSHIEMKKAKVLILVVLLLGAVALGLGIWFSTYATAERQLVDKLNEKAYTFQYKQLDSVSSYANRAYSLSAGYDVGKAEAMNNLAFVDIIKMNYSTAFLRLDSISDVTDNQVELLISDIQRMRLCQRRSLNKDFYDYREQAKRRIRRIKEEENLLTEHQFRRFLYAQTELLLVTSIYYYYVGLEKPSHDALLSINGEELLQQDTAQYLNYTYNIGAGGVLKGKNQDEIYQKEFEVLMRCYEIACEHGYIYFEANALQAISEKLLKTSAPEKLIANNPPAFALINSNHVPDELLAGNLAERALALFSFYGDIYQRASAYRTLASCYWDIKDYHSAVFYLQSALKENPAISQVPDLLASIYEQLSVTFSAINDKHTSDYYRNQYLDRQEQTRQDRYLEARAGQLTQVSEQLNYMIISVIIVIVIVILLLFIFHRMKKRDSNGATLSQLMQPLEEWQQRHNVAMEALQEELEEIEEAGQVEQVHVVKNKEKSLEQRAKVSLLNAITPFIDRILHEIRQLKTKKEDEATRKQRLLYVSELTEKINEYNNVLTEWIQLKQGELSLHIERFSVQDVFDVIEKGRRGFILKGIDLQIHPSSDIVKADKGLTLFMINTLADNARKFTPAGGRVEIGSKATDDYVEIFVTDNGTGIAPEVLKDIFSPKVIIDNPKDESHGFGLMNCNGIINKYKKTSKLFSVCLLGAESEVGQGSRFFFRLPRGISHLLLLLSTWACLSLLPTSLVAAEKRQKSEREADIVPSKYLDAANHYADSAYYSNVKGNYDATMRFVDSCLVNLNKHYLLLYPKGKYLMRFNASKTEVAAEIFWFQNGVNTNYSIILDIRNECAVAALALHQWDLYRYNNSIFTHLYKEYYADRTLADYCRMMQRSKTNKNVAISLLIVFLLTIPVIYYFMYYRHQLFYKFCVEQLRGINDILLSDWTTEEKLRRINKVKTDKFPLSLREIVDTIIDALQAAKTQEERMLLRIEWSTDHLKRLAYEDQNLHVSNNILDNCLSTLKHETMYYPSRIKQLVDNQGDFETIDELASYYKELYTLLSLQILRQVSSQKQSVTKVLLTEALPKNVAVRGLSAEQTSVIGDTDLLKYLFRVLQKQMGVAFSEVVLNDVEGGYLSIQIATQQKQLFNLATEDLFSPHTESIPLFVCRQILREIGERTNHRRCGIVINEQNEEIIIQIILTKANQ